MSFDCTSCAKNIIDGVGGYDNILAVKDCFAYLAVSVRNDRLIDKSKIEDGEWIIICDVEDGIVKLVFGLGFTSASYSVCSECARLLNEYDRTNRRAYDDCADASDNTDTDSQDPDENASCADASDTDKLRRIAGNKYTADYFMKATEKGLSGLKLARMEKGVIKGFISTIAADAARFANEKGLDGEFEFQTEFADVILSSMRNGKQADINGTAFISMDKSARIIVQYQEGEKGEGYNIIVTDVEAEGTVTYAGKMNGSDNTRKMPVNDGRSDREEQAHDLENTTDSGIEDGTALYIIVLLIIIWAICMSIFSKPVQDVSTHDQHTAQTPVVQDAYEEKETEAKQEQSDTSAGDISEQRMKAIGSCISVISLTSTFLGVIFVVAGIVRAMVSHAEENGYERQRAVMITASGMALLMVRFIIPSVILPILSGM